MATDLHSSIAFVSMTSNKGEQFQLKYGVTSMNSLIHDLMNWETMYLSGRLHKPVAIIRNSPNISLLNQYNLVNAIKLSLLLLNKPEIREFELYHQIASLSYTGDPRLKVRGEDPNKVNNIVSNQFDKFREMYLPLLTNYFPTLIQLQTPSDAEEHVFKINTSTEAKSLILVDLPKSFRKKILSKYTTKYASEYQNDLISQHTINPSLETQEKLLPGKDMSFADLQAFSTELTNSTTTKNSKLSEINRKDWEYLSNIAKIHSNEFIAKVSNDEQLVNTLKACVTETVKWPALVQSLKGVSTAGLGRSWRYASEKRKKYDAGIGKN